MGNFFYANLYSKAISCIINGLSCNKFHKVMNITYAKEMWNYLEVTHEGTNEIKNSKINMLTQEFESIRLFPNESIDEFLNWFKSITNNLQSLEKSLIVLKWTIKCWDIYLRNKIVSSIPLRSTKISTLFLPRINGDFDGC